MKFSLTPLLCSLILGLFFVTTSCKKENDPTPIGPPVLGKTYRLASFTLSPGLDLDGDGKIDTDLTILMDDCELDNTITFTTGGKITVSFGASKCPDDNPADLNGGTWAYDDASKVLKVTDRDDPTVVTEWDVVGNQIQTIIQFEEAGVTYKGTMIWKAV